MNTAFITGGNRGIGLSLCKKFAVDMNYKVYMGTRVLDRAAAAIESIGNPPNIFPIAIDVEFEESIADAYATYSRMKAPGETLNVFINNAAAQLDWIPNALYQKILDIPADTLQRIFRINTIAAVLTAKHFLPSMTRGSRIVNVASGAAELSHESALFDAYGGYAPSKLALLMITKKLAAALHEQGMVVNAACPGWCLTEMGGSSAPTSADFGADSIIAACFLEEENPPIGQFFRYGVRVPVDLPAKNEKIRDFASVINHLNIFLEANRNKKICIYGAGRFAEAFFNVLDRSGLNIIGFIDKDTGKHGKTIHGYTIYPIDSISDLGPEIVFVALGTPGIALADLEAARAKTGLDFQIIHDLWQ